MNLLYGANGVLSIKSPLQLFASPQGGFDIRKVMQAIYDSPSFFHMPSITTLISDIRYLFINVKISKVNNDQKGRIVYADKYHLTEEYITSGQVRINDKGRVDGLNSAADLVSQLFGIRDVRFEVELPTIKKYYKTVLKGGFESSTIYLFALLQACNEFTGAGFSEGDLYAIAVALSNGHIGDTTGGDGIAAASKGNGRISFLGGNLDGQIVNPFGIIFDPLWKNKRILRLLSPHFRKSQLKQPEELPRI